MKRLAGPILSLGVLAAAPAMRPASTGVYSQAQAARGVQTYVAHCASCHGGGMEGLDVAPPIVGGHFMADWGNQPVAALFAKIKATMPQDNPGSLGSAQVADLVAEMLQANGFPAGKDDLPADAKQLQSIVIDRPGPTGN